MTRAQTYDILDAGPRNRFMVSGRIVHNCTGDGPQPTNFPKAGPNVWRCRCGRHYGESRPACPWCGAGPEARVDHKGNPAAGSSEWSPEAMNDAIEVMRAGDLDLLELFFGEALLTIAGCLRGTFIAAPGHDLISSDWTAIEAVVLACLAGEQWRVDLFRQGGKIYEASGARVGGVPYEDLLEHKKRTGQHHPLRQVGKTCELALGYQGWVGAWRAFDPNGVQTDDELKKIILAWRDASPAIVEFWGGQTRKRGYDTVEEYFGVEGAFIQAILNPGTVFDCRGLKFQMEGKAVYITLLSGRRLAYHDAQLHPSDKQGSRYSISYWGWNTNPKNGPRGWIQIRTWGGRLVENLVQAVANDLLRFASVNLERAGYAITLHVYDELVCEVPQGQGSVEELEAWMRYLPPWAVCEDGQRWPVGAAGGWRADRYRKG
jgi:DNA polymerase